MTKAASPEAALLYPEADSRKCDHPQMESGAPRPLAVGHR